MEFRGFLAFFFLLLSAAVLASESDKKNDLLDVEDDEEVDDHMKGDRGIFLLPRQAKTLLRVRRWGIKSLWGEEQEEESESRERRAEANRRAEHQRACQRSCWGGWTGWSSCSTPCGSSGTKRRTRSHAPSSSCRAVIAQAGCPGISVQTTACGRSCQNQGTLRSTDCSCRAGYNGRCCENRVTCGFPGSPNKGQVSPTGSRHYYGVTASYSCQTGYTLQGSRTRVCQNSGQWSGSLPTCQIKNCGDPGAPAHGSRQGSNFEFGRSVVFTCQTGYMLNGQATLACDANGNWNYPKPTCQIVQCPALHNPSNGALSLPRRTYQTVAAYSCNTGYVAQGSSRRTCQANRQWSGSPFSCKQIQCPALAAPSHGGVRPVASGKVAYGTVVQYSCQTGYRIQGPSSRTCEGTSATGSWTGSQPRCDPVNCGNPGTPTNGVKEGSVFTLNNRVQFNCQPGYKLAGSTEITCMSSGRWSGGKPSCLACPRNSYKIGLSTASTCSNCPSNSQTVTTASPTKQHCICNNGFRGQAGGPCQEILCPNLTPPANARLASCSRKINSVCKIGCNAGYVVSAGSEFRMCLPDGSWAGSDLVCRACPMNTYKANNSTCTQCPDHSTTSATGNSLQGCRCNAGYHGPAGGPCNDADECSQTPGCEQTCVNTPGSYRCTCTVPGYVQHASDPKSCLMKNSCPDLDAPDNGGVVCVQEPSTNTARCQVKCNAGFEHPLQPNVYEECGPNTAWSWSTDMSDALLGCTKAIFAGVALELEVAYFTDDCNSLTAAQKQQISEEFMSLLRSRSVCVEDGKDTCDTGSTTITCGTETDDDMSFFDDWDMGFRKKRSTRSAMILKFVLKTKENSAANCSKVCWNDISDDCLRNCENNMAQKANTSLLCAANKVQGIFSNARSSLSHPNSEMRPSSALPIQPPSISIAGLNLVPMQGVRRHAPITQCPSGMIKRNQTCIECPAGTHLPPGSAECALCPMGTHQPNARQTFCIPCVMRPTTITKNGATSCDQVIRLVIRPGGFLGHSPP